MIERTRFNLLAQTPKNFRSIIYKASNITSNFKKIHFYPFGGMKRTSIWANALINNEISIIKNGGIKINDFKF